MKTNEKELELETAFDWDESQTDALQNLYVEEIRIACLQGLLLCLDRDHRLAFLLADVFDVTGDQGAAILDISPPAFRKRLSRSRERIRDFLNRNCTLIHPDNPCTCERFVVPHRESERFKEPNLIFATHPCRIRHDQSVLDRVREVEILKKIGFYFKHYPPDLTPPAALIEQLRKLIDSKSFKLLQ